MMEVVVTAGAIKTCKAPVESSPPTNEHPAFYRPDTVPVSQPTARQSTEGKIITFHGLAHPKLTWGLQPCLCPLKATGYL